MGTPLSIDVYAVHATPGPMWRLLAVLATLGPGDEIGGAALRRAAGYGPAAGDGTHFQQQMLFARETGLVRFRRPTFRGELGESPTVNAPWIYSITDLGRSLLAVRNASSPRRVVKEISVRNDEI